MFPSSGSLNRKRCDPHRAATKHPFTFVRINFGDFERAHHCFSCLIRVGLRQAFDHFQRRRENDRVASIRRDRLKGCQIAHDQTCKGREAFQDWEQIEAAYGFGQKARKEKASANV